MIERAFTFLLFQFHFYLHMQTAHFLNNVILHSVLRWIFLPLRRTGSTFDVTERELTKGSLAGAPAGLHDATSIEMLHETFR